MSKWSRAPGQLLENHWVINFSDIFVPVPIFANFCKSGVHCAFLSIVLCIKYIQSNFEVPGVLRSISMGLIPTVLIKHRGVYFHLYIL
jgi:hypothetical protein